MMAALRTLLVVALVLGVLAGDVLALGDREVLTSPPEAVAEGFVRKLETGRYAMSREQLEPELAKRTPAGELEAAWKAVERRTGPVEDVRGEPERSDGDRAEARAVLVLHGGRELPLRLGLRRESGVWLIDDLGDLDPARAGGPVSGLGRPGSLRMPGRACRPATGGMG